MSETSDNVQLEKPKTPKWPILLLVLIVGLYVFTTAIWPAIEYHLYRSRQNQCGKKLFELGKILELYTEDHNGKYPADNWCDLLLDGGYVPEEQFVCPGGGKGRCHYAMNKGAVGTRTSDAPSDMVVLFETEAGWNQVGGPEILTTRNHSGEGCNILFNDRHVRFFSPQKLGQLRWKAEEDKK